MSSLTLLEEGEEEEKPIEGISNKNCFPIYLIFSFLALKWVDSFIFSSGFVNQLIFLFLFAFVVLALVISKNWNNVTASMLNPITGHRISTMSDFCCLGLKQ